MASPSHQDLDLYAVEDRVARWTTLPQPVAVWGSLWDPERVAVFADLPAVARYVEQVIAHLRREGPYAGAAQAPLAVRPRRAAGRAHYEPGVVAVPRREIGGGWSHTELVILHEIAHHLAPGDRHGPAFRRAWVDVLDTTGHPVLARMAEIALVEAGLGPGPPRRAG